MQIEPYSIELKCSYLSLKAMCSYICSTLVYQVFFFKKTYKYHMHVTFNWYMQGKQSTPGGMQGSKGREMWIKVRYFLKKKKYIPKGEKYLSESSHEGEVARSGEEQRGKSWF